ncbi:MAG: ABC transporter ATP-binding protein [Clostridia bacterium]
MLKLDNVSVKINNNNILNNISFEIEENDMFMIIGPNGSGKTTIVKTIMNDLKYTGTIKLDNINIKEIKLSNISKKLGVLMQNHNLEFDNTVYDIVSLGRYTHIKDIFGKLTSFDLQKINEAISLADLENLKYNSINEISGGQLQRVFLALTLAQDPDILILDEPTNHLDLKHQIDIFEILDKWRKNNNKAIIAIIHDLNLVYKYSNKCLIIKDGNIIACGNTKKTLTSDNLRIAYDVDIFKWMKDLLENYK